MRWRGTASGRTGRPRVPRRPSRSPTTRSCAAHCDLGPARSASACMTWRSPGRPRPRRPPRFGGCAKSAAEPARRAAMQGTLAMAALGATLFGDPGFDDPDKSDYNKTLERLRGLTSADSWHEDAVHLGDRIGLRFRKLRGRIDALVDEGRGLTELATRLAAADGLARLVDRGEDPPAGSAVEPSSRYRRLRAHELLVWMAERAWLDHWYNKDPRRPAVLRRDRHPAVQRRPGALPRLPRRRPQEPRRARGARTAWKSRTVPSAWSSPASSMSPPGTASSTRRGRGWSRCRPASRSSGRRSADR